MFPWSAAQSVLRWPVWLAVGVVTTADAGEATVVGGIATAPLAPARRRGAVLGCRGAGRPGDPGWRVRPPGATPERAGADAFAWSADRPVALRLGRGELRVPGDLPWP